MDQARRRSPQTDTSWGPFYVLRANAEADVKAIVEEVVSRPGAPGSIERKIADFYKAYLDTGAIETAGLNPISAEQAENAAAGSYDEVASLMGRSDISVGGPVSMSPWPDAKNPDRYGINIVQSGLGLPDRNYYLGDDAKLVEIRGKYRIYAERMLGLAAYPQSGRAADAILALETGMARVQWSNEKRGERDLTYNPMSRAELKAFAPGFVWDAALSAQGIPTQDFFVVKELDAVGDLTRIFRTTPVETWRAYMTFHYLDAMADVLPAAFDGLAFDFNGRTLSGQPQQRERWKRATVER